MHVLAAEWIVVQGARERMFFSPRWLRVGAQGRWPAVRSTSSVCYERGQCRPAGAGGPRLVLAGKRLRSDLVGGHDPQLADGGVAGAGDHVSDAVRDVLRGEDLGLLVEGVDHLVADLGFVVRAQFGRDAAGLDEADAHVPLGEFLAQGLGEAVYA